MLIVLAVVTLLAISLLKVYRQLPVRELKHRARQGDQQSVALHKAAAYGTSLYALLWLVVGVLSAVFFWYAAKNTPAVAAVGLSALLLWYGFVWMPGHAGLDGLSKKLAAMLAPACAWILQYTHGPIDATIRFIQQHWPVSVHTGLYDRDDLLELLQYQASQPDSRVSPTQLELAHHALTFGDQQIAAIMTPRRAVKMVPVDESAGPVLMTELHESGFTRFPVYEGKKNNIVGTLFLRDLVKGKTGGAIAKLMRQDVAFVHEQQRLSDALQAILKTRHHLLIVVNEFEEYVGILTIEDVLEQLVGSPILDDFDQYEDRQAVASRGIVADQLLPEEAPEPAPPTEEATEVVE